MGLRSTTTRNLKECCTKLMLLTITIIAEITIGIEGDARAFYLTVLLQAINTIVDVMGYLETSSYEFCCIRREVMVLGANALAIIIAVCYSFSAETNVIHKALENMAVIIICAILVAAVLGALGRELKIHIDLLKPKSNEPHQNDDSDISTSWEDR